ncbi:MAG: histidine phosphatase family protein [Deltaproteobacteria bacterium]|nr:histidine phosphatase family protein [Deltaproteobacteria bacterium]MBW2048280.1 histidine phosphatase family protein [Deltaproteobacteria bacterium]MBW2109990.1 histidine phosphatase family protein [Deltaproteobacteria bacterium]MBW2351809.1 histidine phosphatase family protein [Deltaproteobacteria bacterium]HDZ89066.1 histidine phosphatase family protein [Deltaproteobacteria bacterium]
MKRENRVYLLRHGQVRGYEDFPAYGHTDVDLTETGILQMERMAERLRLTEPAAIYSSDLKRSAIGARLIARHHDVPLHFLPELREMNLGDWEGLTLSDIMRDFPEELEKREAGLINYRPPGEGESVADLSGRIMHVFEGIRVEQEGNDIIIVAHAGVNRVILCAALGLDLDMMYNIHQSYGCLNIIDYFPQSTLVHLING